MDAALALEDEVFRFVYTVYSWIHMTSGDGKPICFTNEQMFRSCYLDLSAVSYETFSISNAPFTDHYVSFDSSRIESVQRSYILIV